MTRYEKGALVRFLGLYLVSMSALALVIALLVFRMEKRSLDEMAQYKIRHEAATVASYIVTAHMARLRAPEDAEGLLQQLPRPEGTHIWLYGEGNRPIMQAPKQLPVPFEAGFYARNGELYFVDQSTYGHLGVQTVVIEAPGMERQYGELQRTILLWLTSALLVIGVVGLALAKLFLVPVKREMERLDRFIKDTTHELNTPIAAILMSISSLKKLGVDEKITSRIALAARRVSDIYQDLTYLFFHELTRHPVVRIDMGELLGERVEYFRDFAAIKRVRMAFEASQEGVYWDMDRESAVRLADNLIGNAIKYNRSGGSVTVRLGQNSFEVRDTGIGMDAMTLQGIFRRYQRGNTGQGGFGIGMDIVASIGKEFDLKIDVASAPGEGSVFTVGRNVVS